MSDTAIATIDPAELVTRAAGGSMTASEVAVIHRLVKIRPGQQMPSREEMALVLSEANHMGIDLFAGQGYIVKLGEAWECYPHWTGLVAIAESTGEYEGSSTPLYSGDGEKWVKAWPGNEPPAFCAVTVYRRGHRPTEAVVKYARAAKSSPIWKAEPEAMLAKCALRLALRRAFPKEADKGLSAEQLRALHTLASLKGMRERDARLGAASEIVGRRVESFKELSRAEATEVFETWAPDIDEDIPDVAEIVDESAGVEQEVIAGDAQDRAAPSAPPAAPLQPAPPPPPPVERRTDGPTAEPQSRGGHPPTPAPASGASDWSASRRQFETTLREAMTTSAVRTKGCVATVLDDRPVSQATDEELDAITALLISNVLQGKRAAR